MTVRTPFRIGVFVAVLAATAFAWMALAPPQLGGSSRYVILEGTSMEPALHAGDLAVVRKQDGVAKGDVILYEHERLGARVLHRIVRVSGDRYVLKGDNNSFLDDARPTAADIEGRLWFTVPAAGSAIAWARQPLHMAAIVFVLVFLALGGGAAVSSRRPGHGRSEAHVRIAEPRSTRGTGGGAHIVLTVGLAALVVFACLALVSYSRATARTETVADAYAHVGTFSYSANVEESDVYPDGTVDSGESVFLQLVPALDVAFDYRLDANNASAVHGDAQLTAVLSDGAAWTREISFGDPVEFEGTSAQLTGTLDLEELSAIVAEMKTLTGSGASTFSLDLVPTVEVDGVVDGAPVSQTFSPQLPLLLDPVSVRPDTSSGDAPALTARRDEAMTVRVPAQLRLGGPAISVANARRLSLLGLGLAVLAALAAAAVYVRTRDGGDPSHVTSLFGDRLITVNAASSGSGARATELTDPESLRRIADHYDRIVLHWRDGRNHVYEVDDGSTIYRYRTGLGVEPGPWPSEDGEDTQVLPATESPTRAVAG